MLSYIKKKLLSCFSSNMMSILSYDCTSLNLYVLKVNSPLRQRTANVSVIVSSMFPLFHKLSAFLYLDRCELYGDTYGIYRMFMEDKWVHVCQLHLLQPVSP